MVDNNILSYIETDVDAGGVHPNTQVTAMTMDVTTLQPVELDSVFTEGYRDIFERAVRENIADSTLLGSWLDAVAHQYDGRGIVVTDTAIILGRDTEWEFSSSHADREFSEIPIPYPMLKEIIRRDGPLGKFIR